MSDDRALYTKALDGSFRPFNDEAVEFAASVKAGRVVALDGVKVRNGWSFVDCSTAAHPNAIIRVDSEDLEWVTSRRWTPQDNGNGGLYFVSVKGPQKLRLHREVARARFNEQVDHIDGNTLNNQRGNLRVCTQQQNVWNQTSHKRGNAFHRGVHRVGERYKAMITCNGITYNLGTFDDADSAALARDAAALYLHGEFASLNFPNIMTLPVEPRPPAKYCRHD